MKTTRYQRFSLFRRSTPGPRCPGCAYWRSLGNRPEDNACLYCLNTGHARKCPVSSCDKFVVKVEVACV